MKTIWQQSLETEVGRIIFTAKSAAKGFYSSKGFYMLPYEQAKGMPGPTVLLPQLDYLAIPRFWLEMFKIDTEHNSPKDFADPNNFSKVRQELKKQLMRKSYGSIGYRALEQQWQKIEKQFFAELEHFVPDIQKRIATITVMPTRFGTSTSFSVPKMFPAKISIYIREDQSVYALAEAICTAIMRHGIMEDLKATWEESELLVDWMVTKTKIATLLEGVAPQSAFTPTMKSTRSTSCASIVSLSNAFCEKLGIHTAGIKFVATATAIQYGDRTLRGISEKEKQVLTTMIEQKNKPISHQEIAKTLYQERVTEKFSLWSIAKFMQRLRNKLEHEGVSSHHIQTVYGKGFMLKA